MGIPFHSFLLPGKIYLVRPNWSNKWGPVPMRQWVSTGGVVAAWEDISAVMEIHQAKEPQQSLTYLFV